MKMVMAVITPSKLENVRAGLTAAGFEGMTVTEVRGFGRQRGHTEIYRGAEYDINFVPKLKVEVAVPADRADDAVAAIRAAANTGKIGAGKIFVLSLDHAMRIRTGDTGAAAL